MKGKGLLMLVGKPKGKEESEEGGGEDSYLAEAFAALKDDDQEGFVAAMRAAIEACMEE